MKRDQMSDYEINEASKFIYSLYFEAGQGLEEEECISEAWLTFFEAKENYRYGTLDYDFWRFAGEKVIQHLEELRKVRSERIRNESKLSLDLQFGDMKESIGSYLFPVQGDFVKSIILWEYAKSLGDEKYMILKLLSQQEEDYQIMERMHLPLEKFYCKKIELKEDLKKYLDS